MSRKDELIREIIRSLGIQTVKSFSIEDDVALVSRALNLLLKDAVEVGVSFTERSGVWYASSYDPEDDKSIKGQYPHDKKAFLIDLKPIKKGVTKEEIVSALRSWEQGDSDLADRIEKEGIIDA